MSGERAMLLQSLSRTISDYRFDEVTAMTPDHIERWLSQFDVKDQPVILHEMDFTMKNFYISRQQAKHYIYEFIKKLIGSTNPEIVLSHTRFLPANQSGRSQEAMLTLVDEILLENYGFTAASIVPYNVQNYIYMDDAIYTGNKIRYSLEKTLSLKRDNTGVEKILIIYVIAAHNSGSKYAISHIRKAYKQFNIKFFTNLVIEDNRSSSANIEILWPDLIRGNLLVDSYASNIYTSHGRKLDIYEIFRPTGHILQEQLFSSPQARKVVERAFLTKGIELIKDNQSKASSIRPLGFMKLASLGFGTLFVTYRNIANNCPLVLWWGDTTYSVTHPFGKWYPLFPRRTNGNAIM
ncbi:MAG TPA: hypothetical protein VFV38_38895 [Ktedonobacteraceae bacterium]|nr:hypothetical protein [Ktedonobacteraceae bacterium]